MTYTETDPLAIVSAIQNETGGTLTSMAQVVGQSDLKTALRRLYTALGGKRGHGGYDPTADELRTLYRIAHGNLDHARADVARLMAKGGATTVPPVERTAPATLSDAEMLAAELARESDANGMRRFKPSKPKAEAETGASDGASDPAAKLAEALAAVMAGQKLTLDPEAIREIVEETMGDRLDGALATIKADATASATLAAIDAAEKATRRLEIVVGKAPAVKIDNAHLALENVLKACAAGVWPFLVGPAGSGKTTLAKQIADALNRPFYMAARVSSEFKLTGFIDATGKAVQTDFRRAYENGGVFLFDEADASDADAFVALNAALANPFADFPDKQVPRHDEFVAIAAGNTYGRGANREYVGRQQLDAATLDRFTIFEVDYDEKLEMAIAGNDDWTRHVQSVRKAVEREKVRHIVSPRASINGAKLLATGMDRKTVEEATIWKGMAEAERNRVTAAIRA